MDHFYVVGTIDSDEPVIDPFGPTLGRYRIHRGGNWHVDVEYLRVAFRNMSEPTYRNSNLGFRITRTSH